MSRDTPSPAPINRTTASTSPEFEFWMFRNPSLPPPSLLSADELFVDGILLPLQLLHLPNQTPPDPLPLSTPADSAAPLSSSKRWTSIFKKATPAKAQPDKREDKEKLEKKKERRTPTGATSAELNINIWPFSRSRSAGNSGTRPKMFPGTRKVNSAPCSRSNSAGDSKSRKWSSSPGRPGVHVGRSSPVRQVRRGAKSSNSEGGVLRRRRDKKEYRGIKTAAEEVGMGGRKSEVVKLKGALCVEYRENIRCRNEESSGRNGGGGSNGSGNAGLFSLRSLMFNKKSIRKSECPKEFEPEDTSSQVHVNLIRRDEQRPRSSAKLHSMVYSMVWVELSVAAVLLQHLNKLLIQFLPMLPPVSSMGLVVDETLPSTSIQLRLADGTRMVAHFNNHHTVNDIRSFLNASRPGGPQNYQLQLMGFPPKLLVNPTQTIEQAGLANSVVIQKFWLS